MDYKSESLVHYGIRGMKWGVRRYQSKDGSLTAAGKKRYSTDIEGAKKKVRDAKSEQKEATKQLEAAKLDVRLAKKVLSSEKTKEALNAERGGKSSRRIKLEEEYMNKGLTQEEAEIAAYRRAKTEKVLIGIAGVTIAAAAGHAVYKHHKKSIDGVVKAATPLRNISSNGNPAVRDAFMKWNTKSYRNKGGSKTTVVRARKRIKNEKKVRREWYKNRRAISMEGLEKKINRMETEKKLKNLINEDIRPGRTMVIEALRSGGSKAISGLVLGGTAYGVQYALTKEFNARTLANFIAPNPNKKK